MNNQYQTFVFSRRRNYILKTLCQIYISDNDQSYIMCVDKQQAENLMREIKSYNSWMRWTPPLKGEIVCGKGHYLVHVTKEKNNDKKRSIRKD